MRDGGARECFSRHDWHPLLCGVFDCHAKDARQSWRFHDNRPLRTRASATSNRRRRSNARSPRYQFSRVGRLRPLIADSAPWYCQALADPCRSETNGSASSQTRQTPQVDAFVLSTPELARLEHGTAWFLTKHEIHPCFTQYAGSTASRPQDIQSRKI